MENITGFIVRVVPFGGKSPEYMYKGEKTTLNINDEFIGYFWQITEKDETGKFHKAHIRKTVLVDPTNLFFQYEGEAIFDVDTVSIEILAKRGPESNNKFLSNEYDQYDTWNAILKD